MPTTLIVRKKEVVAKSDSISSFIVGAAEAEEYEQYEQSNWQATSAGQRGNENVDTAHGQQQVPEDEPATTANSDSVYSMNVRIAI